MEKCFFIIWLVLLVGLIQLSSTAQDSCTINDLFPCDAGTETCMRRKFGSNEFVCVCDESYCDDIGPNPETSNGQITIYESNEDGLRFRKSYIIKGKSSLTESSDQITLQQVQITIKPNEKHQKLFGFGGAFTDSTGINLLDLNETLADHVINDYFNEKTGIGYSVGRIPIGGSDFSNRAYTYDDDHLEDFNLTYFALAEDDLIYKIPYIKRALELNPDLQLFASAWSPPAWMKTSNSISKRGYLKGKPGDQYYKAWAKYYVKFFEEYQSKGINFWGLTTGNEPISSYLHSAFNALSFTPTSQRDFITSDLGPALAEAGFPLKEKLQLLIFDDQLPFALVWVGKILGEKEAAKLVSGVAFHWYGNMVTPKSVLSLLNKWYPNNLWISSEACEGYRLIFDPVKVSLGNWHRGQNYADDIITDLNHGAHGWIDWNMVLDLQGGPNWAHNYVDAPIIVNKTANEYYRQPLFYAMAHISKFLKPGAVRLETKGSHGGVELTVFETPDNNIVTIILNKNSYPIDLTLNGGYVEKIKWRLTAKSLTTIVGAKVLP